MALRIEILNAVRGDSLEPFIKIVKPEDAMAKGDPTIDSDGSYLHYCVEKNRIDMAKHLIKLGADVNHRGGVWEATPMTYAADRGHLEMVKLLREHGGEFDLYGDPIRNPLLMAIREGHIDVVRYLLEAGIDPHVVYRVDRGKLRNALNRAQEDGQKEIVALLEAHGCRPPVEGVDKPVWEMLQKEWSEEHPVHEQIVAYMAERFGPVDELGMQEILPVLDDMSVAINVIRPNEEHPYLVLFTNGMSDRAMKVSPDQEAWQYAELVMHLPPDWPHPRDANGDPQWLWPVQWLRKAAYIPHLNDTWLAPPGTIISSADPPEPLGPNTQQTCLLLIPDFANLGQPLQREDGGQVHFFTVVPLCTEERDFELQHGMTAFFKRFIERKVPMIVDIYRPSFVD
jgi:hypothetical protein